MPAHATTPAAFIPLLTTPSLQAMNARYQVLLASFVSPVPQAAAQHTVARNRPTMQSWSTRPPTASQRGNRNKRRRVESTTNTAEREPNPGEETELEGDETEPETQPTPPPPPPPRTQTEGRNAEPGRPPRLTLRLDGRRPMGYQARRPSASRVEGGEAVGVASSMRSRMTTNAIATTTTTTMAAITTTTTTTTVARPTPAIPPPRPESTRRTNPPKSKGKSKSKTTRTRTSHSTAAAAAAAAEEEEEEPTLPPTAQASAPRARHPTRTTRSTALRPASPPPRPAIAREPDVDWDTTQWDGRALPTDANYNGMVHPRVAFRRFFAGVDIYHVRWRELMVYNWVAGRWEIIGSV